MVDPAYRNDRVGVGPYDLAMGTSKARTRIWIAVAVGVVAMAAVVFAIVQLTNMNKLNDYIAHLLADPTVSLSSEITRDQYQRTMDRQCGLLADGWTLADAQRAGENNWESVEGTSEVSREQFIANGVGMLRAAQAVC